MKNLSFRKVCFSLVLLMTLGAQSLVAQENEIKSKKPYSSQTYFSFGAGMSFLSGTQDQFYQDGHSNVQIGFMKEFPATQRVSWVAGLELERLTYSLDFFPEEGEGGKRFIPAPDGVKYTRIFQNSLNLSAQTRIYFRDNSSEQSSNIFLQAGFRAGYNLSTTFSYRESSAQESINLSEITQPINLQAEFLLGFKGAYFDKLAILNSSSFGLIYQFNNPWSAGNVGNVKPIHLTWRFLF